MSPPRATGHEHISDVRWHEAGSTKTEESSALTIINWIKGKNGNAQVKDGIGSVQVGVVDANPPYLRTHKDGRFTDNLLSLPRF